MVQKRIAYYLRNSTDQQDYEYQFNNLNTHFMQFKNLDLVHIYGEKISGFTNEKDRPEMKKLLESVSNGEIDEIWVNEITRLSRNAINLQEIVIECERHEVNIFFKNQSLNSLDDERKVNPVTRLIISILAQFAQMDAENLFSKSKQGKASKAKLGNYVGGTLPTGYNYENNTIAKTKKIIVDNKQKKVVEYIFDAYVNKNKTLARICNELNNLKIFDSDFFTPMKYKEKGQKTGKWKYNSWTPTTLKRIINCTWYAEGIRYWKTEKIVLEDSLKFIDIGIYNKANEMLRENQHGGQKRLYTYLIKHLLFCDCGAKMNPKNSINRIQYRCSRQNMGDYDKSIKCNVAKSLEIEQIENSIWLLIKNKLPEFKITVQNKVNKEAKVKSKVEYNNELIRIIENITINDLREQRKRSLLTYTRFGGDIDDFEKIINELDKKIKEQIVIKSELEFDNKRLLYSLQEQDIVAEIEYKINDIEQDKEQIRFYVKKLIKKITSCGGLSNTSKNLVEIQWKEGINNDKSTFLFYKSKNASNPFYYYINSLNDDLDIKWNMEKKSFIISDLNDYIEFDFDQMQNKIDDSYEMKNRHMKVKKTHFANVFMKDNNALPINMGRDKLIIVSPFVKIVN
jgi:DNA invertase Pin-like site-specific DNA recombinase